MKIEKNFGSTSDKEDFSRMEAVLFDADASGSPFGYVF
jgi:hypothetical protein